MIGGNLLYIPLCQNTPFFHFLTRKVPTWSLNTFFLIKIFSLFSVICHIETVPYIVSLTYGIEKMLGGLESVPIALSTKNESFIGHNFEKRNDPKWVIENAY